MEKILINSVAWKTLRDSTARVQDNRCAICSVDLSVVARGPQLDHSHDTGIIRGVLCFSCNSKLGWWESRKQRIEQYFTKAEKLASHQVETPKERAARKLAHRQNAL